MNQIMKKNLPLVIGLAIPLLMIVFVAVSIYVPSLFAKPEYSFVYAVKDNYDMYGDNYSVENGTIVKKNVPYPTSTDPYYDRYPAPKVPETKSYLFMFDINTKTAKELSFEDAKKLSLIETKNSPDGYELEQGSTDNGVFEIFGGYSASPDWFLRKGAMNKRITLQFPPSTDTRYYYYNSNFQFLGWIKK
jgi:hypothetical protein